MVSPASIVSPGANTGGGAGEWMEGGDVSVWREQAQLVKLAVRRALQVAIAVVLVMVVLLVAGRRRRRRR